jgi:hypothetical protein
MKEKIAKAIELVHTFHEKVLYLSESSMASMDSLKRRRHGTRPYEPLFCGDRSILRFSLDLEPLRCRKVNFSLGALSGMEVDFSTILVGES